MGLFLEQFTQEHSQEIHIIQLDNAPCHTAHKLIVPDNVILLFQLPTHLELNSRWNVAVHSAPPYCPEVNPIERVWQYLKQQLKNLFFTSLEDIKERVANILNSLSEDLIHSLTGWQYILDALSL